MQPGTVVHAAHGEDRLELLPDAAGPVVQVCRANQWQQQLDPLPPNARLPSAHRCCLDTVSSCYWRLQHSAVVSPRSADCRVFVLLQAARLLYDALDCNTADMPTLYNSIRRATQCQQAKSVRR